VPEPQTCGKVERCHQTLKGFLAKRDPAASIAELQAQVDGIVEYYNERGTSRMSGVECR
jgi:transposase InsO family protein